MLDEVIRLFPSRYIHIGGDEASRRHWKACPKCQKRMKEEGLKDESELQSYMIARIEKYLNDKGREIIGWDEILDGGMTLRHSLWRLAPASPSDRPTPTTRLPIHWEQISANIY